MSPVAAPARLKYALVTPARNERDNLERLAASILAQRVEPEAWIVVDDSSDDGTAELLSGLAQTTPWIHVAGAARASDPLASGRQQGRALDGFRAGVRALPEPVDIVVKVDADTSFDADYFDRIIGCFERDPRLGIAGGACYELEGGVWTRQKVAANHPRGASRAYRWACLDDVMTLESKMGWDGLDEVKAGLRGYTSRAILEVGFRHHRPTGGRERNRLGHQAAQGRAAWYMGYRPTYLLMRAAYRARRDPAAVGMVAGYARSALTRAPRHREREVIERVRSEQRLRRALRRRPPP